MFDQFKKIDLLSIISSMKKKDISDMMDVYNKNNNQSIEQTIHKKKNSIHHKMNTMINREQSNFTINKNKNKNKSRSKSKSKSTSNDIKKNQNQKLKEQAYQDKKNHDHKDQKDIKENATKVVQKKKIKISKENLHKKIHTFTRAMNNNKIYDQV